jgi:large-conductance mechanosensitive channel
VAKKRKKKKEISVRAPDYIPKKAPIFKDTTGTEALDVFKVAEIVGRVLSFIMVAFGIFVVVLSLYSSLTSVNMFLNPLFLGVIGLVGALNIFCGLILLAKK